MTVFFVPNCPQKKKRDRVTKLMFDQSIPLVLNENCSKNDCLFRAKLSKKKGEQDKLLEVCPVHYVLTINFRKFEKIIIIWDHFRESKEIL